jgi:hypothetical protein
MGVTLETVMGYLYYHVGCGTIRRSDIVFSINESTRKNVEWAIPQIEDPSASKICNFITQHIRNQANFEDVSVYLVLRDARIALGDLYEYIREIEVALHLTIRGVLKSEYGADQWWRAGIPKDIRASCASTLEEDPKPASHPYCCTDFIHLKEILDKQWPVFSRVLPRTLVADKKQLLADLTKLNRIRNSVMHPIKDADLTSEAFGFVRAFRTNLDMDALEQLA